VQQFLGVNNPIRLEAELLTAGVRRPIVIAVPFEWRHGPAFAGEGTGEIMPVQSIIVWLIVGAIAGWLAGKVVRGGGFGLIGDIVVGIVGAIIAGYLFPYLHINLGTGFVRAVIDAFIGAVILLVILRLVTGMGKR
jgi:uncharacterized membrane protein YeaQ/YmgE (transglycosylase-associated protein family)